MVPRSAEAVKIVVVYEHSINHCHAWGVQYSCDTVRNWSSTSFFVSERGRVSGQGGAPMPDLNLSWHVSTFMPVEMEGTECDHPPPHVWCIISVVLSTPTPLSRYTSPCVNILQWSRCPRRTIDSGGWVGFKPSDYGTNVSKYFRERYFHAVRFLPMYAPLRLPSKPLSAAELNAWCIMATPVPLCFFSFRHCICTPHTSRSGPRNTCKMIVFFTIYLGRPKLRGKFPMFLSVHINEFPVKTLLRDFRRRSPIC